MKVLAWPAFDYEPFNPYNWLLNKNLEKHDVQIIPYSHSRVLTSNYDIWHMHWPAENVIRKSLMQSVIRFIGFFLLLTLAKFKKAKIVWTAHNFEMHESLHPEIEKIFWSVFPKYVDGYVIHSNYANSILKEKHGRFAKTNHAVIYHGHYKEWYSNKISSDEARSQLRLDEDCFVFLFIGSIRPYKNIITLLNAFDDLKNERNKLIIAGNSNSVTLGNQIHDYTIKNADIIYHNKWVNDEEFQVYFNAADIAVLPYNIPSSGMALLSLSFDCPILMPKNPMLEEYRDIMSDHQLYLYDDILTSKILKRVKNELLAKRSLKVNDSDNLKVLDWYNLADKTKQFYTQLLKNK